MTGVIQSSSWEEKHNENKDEALHEGPQRLDQLQLKGNSSTLTEPQNTRYSLEKNFGNLSQISSTAYPRLGPLKTAAWDHSREHKGALGA